MNAVPLPRGQAAKEMSERLRAPMWRRRYSPGQRPGTWRRDSVALKGRDESTSHPGQGRTKGPEDHLNSQAPDPGPRLGEAGQAGAMGQGGGDGLCPVCRGTARRPGLRPNCLAQRRISAHNEGVSEANDIPGASPTNLARTIEASRAHDGRGGVWRFPEGLSGPPVKIVT